MQSITQKSKMIVEAWDRLRDKYWVQSTGLSRDIFTTQKINEELSFDLAKDVAMLTNRKVYFIQ